MEHIPKEKKRAKNRRACPLPGDESQLPVHYSAGEPRLEIIGDRVLVDGLRRVLSYTSERLVLQVGKRRVTLVGADLCLLDYSPLGVQVTGTLETYLAQNGVAVGKPWQGAARSRLNYRLLRDFPDLAWAHINKVGATARLEVAERVDTPKTKSDKEQSQWGAARRELRCTVRRLQVHRVQTGRQVCRGVYFYGLTLVPMGKDAPPMTEVTEQRRLLRLNGRALPMGSVTRTRTAYRRVEQRLTVQAATALAKAALEEKRAQELPGATIINACVTVEVTPDTVTAVGAYTVQVQSLQTDRDRA